MRTPSIPNFASADWAQIPMGFGNLGDTRYSQGSARGAVEPYSPGFQQYAVIPQKPRVVVYTFAGGEICRDGSCDATTDRKAQAMYQTILKVDKFFRENFQLSGLDGKGNLVPVYINWDVNNAQWSCSSADCKLQFHDDYVNQPEVVAHEYVHGILSRLRNLGHTMEAGALNESLADVFGITFKHWLTGNHGDWKIVDRDLEKHPRPYQKAIRPTVGNDNGYVHANSTIPSHAFRQVVCAKGVESMQIAHIWFEAMMQVSPNETFSRFAGRTIEVANQWTKNSAANRKLAAIIHESWEHVDVRPSFY